MEVVSEGRKRIVRIAVAALGLTALLALQPESARLVEPAWARSAGGTTRGPIVRKLILSDQARRFLALQYRSYPTEFMGCMRSEERRVGKECRSRWSAYDEKKT